MRGGAWLEKSFDARDRTGDDVSPDLGLLELRTEYRGAAEALREATAVVAARTCRDCRDSRESRDAGDAGAVAPAPGAAGVVGAVGAVAVAVRVAGRPADACYSGCGHVTRCFGCAQKSGVPLDSADPFDPADAPGTRRSTRSVRALVARRRNSGRDAAIALSPLGAPKADASFEGECPTCGHVSAVVRLGYHFI